MLLQKIVLENYGIYQDQNVFDFATTKDKPIILCGGKNGGGKTTLFESVMLCLYGQNFSEKKISKKVSISKGELEKRLSVIKEEKKTEEC